MASDTIPGLAQRALEARNHMSWSLQEAADQIGCSKSFLWEVENERRSPSAHNALRMCFAYGRTPN